ncbi:hypothetical protein KCU67_g500, partial [Aureobasidium melanogenum]
MTRDIANCLLLCSNLHKTFDDRIWVFFPKGPNTLVAHFLQAAPDQAALYHNVAAHPVQCGPHFLYARFAWAIMSLLRAYLSKSTPRKVKVVEFEHLRTAKRHKSSGSVGTEFTTQSTVAGPSLSGGADHYSVGVQIHESAGSTDEQGELEEDLILMERRLPELEGMPESQKPKSWYPGWRRIERMKQTWAAADRKRSVHSQDAQQVAMGDQYATTGCESVTSALVTSDDSGEDNRPHLQGD